MAIDPSIAVGQAPGSLLGTLTGATNLRGQIMQQRANTAMSDALQQSIDPATGQPNIQKAMSLIAHSPDAAYNLPAFQSQMLQNQTQQVQYDTGKLELAKKTNDLLAGGFGSLLTMPNPTQADVMKLASLGIKQNLFTGDEAVNYLADMPNEPGALREWIKQRAVGFNENLDRLKVLQPQTQILNNGSSQQIMAIDPNTGQPILTGVVQNTLTPGQAAESVPFFDPATQTMRTITKAEQLQMQNGGAMGGGVPGQGGALGTGRINAAPTAPGLQAAPALGSAEAASVIGKGSAEASQLLQKQSDAAPQAIYQFQNMRAALPDIDTGPGTDWRNTAAAFATAISPDIAAKIGFDPQKVASYEEFKKYATQAAQATLAGLGEGTDLKLASAVSANPGTNLSKLGNQHLIDVLIAGQRATLAKNQAWQNSGLPPEQYNKFSTQWSKEIDPRVFAAQDMDATARYKMLDSLPKKDQETFKRSYLNARNLGYVQ